MNWVRQILIGASFAGSAGVHPLAAAEITVPSGQPVEFVDLIRDVESVAGVTWRFRFLAPQIARDRGLVALDTVLSDIDALCREVAQPQVALAVEKPQQVIISLSDRAVEFGVASPEATQYFEAYRIENTHCIWEGF